MSDCKEEKQPCSKECACYIARTLCELKECVKTRVEAVKCLAEGPEWKISLNEEEREGLAPICDEGEKTVVGCIVAREIGSREHDLANMREASRDIMAQAEQFKPCIDKIRMSLDEAKNKIIQARSSNSRRMRDLEERQRRKQETLEASAHRRQKLKAMSDILVARHEELSVLHDPEKSPGRGVDRDHELDRAALNSALKALCRLDESDCECDDDNPESPGTTGASYVIDS